MFETNRRPSSHSIIVETVNFPIIAGYLIDELYVSRFSHNVGDVEGNTAMTVNFTTTAGQLIDSL